MNIYHPYHGAHVPGLTTPEIRGGSKQVMVLFKQRSIMIAPQ